MKKVLSMILALIIIASVGTVAVSAADYRITVAPTVDHIRKDNIAYYPIKFDVDKINGTYAELCSSKGITAVSTHIELGYSYQKDTLKFIDAIPAEALHNLGGTLKVTEQGTEDSRFDFFCIEIDFLGTEGLADEYFFNLKFEVLKENFLGSGGIAKSLLTTYPVTLDYDNNVFIDCVWDVVDANGKIHDLSEKIDTSYASFGDGYTSYDQMLIKDYEPFIPPVVETDITEVTYIQSDDTHKNFTVTVNGRKQMIQFIEPDSGTRTYDRYHKNVKITSYNANGEIISAMSRDLAYEVWEIYSNMSVGAQIRVRGKENYTWDDNTYRFTVKKYNPVISMTFLSFENKKGKVPTEVITDDKTEKVMFKMPNKTSVTVSSFTTDENGNRVFRGDSWINDDFYNEIKVYIRRNNTWIYVGSLNYIVYPE